MRARAPVGAGPPPPRRGLHRRARGGGRGAGRRALDPPGDELPDPRGRHPRPALVLRGADAAGQLVELSAAQARRRVERHRGRARGDLLLPRRGPARHGGPPHLRPRRGVGRDRHDRRRRRLPRPARLPRAVHGVARPRPLVPERSGRAGRRALDGDQRRSRPRLDPRRLGGPDGRPAGADDDGGRDGGRDRDGAAHGRSGGRAVPGGAALRARRRGAAVLRGRPRHLRPRERRRARPGAPRGRGAAALRAGPERAGDGARRLRLRQGDQPARDVGVHVVDRARRDQHGHGRRARDGEPAAGAAPAGRRLRHTPRRGRCSKSSSCPDAPETSVNDAFRPVCRFWDRVWRPEQLPAALLGAMRVLTDPAESGRPASRSRRTSRPRRGTSPRSSSPSGTGSSRARFPTRRSCGVRPS